MKRTDLQKLLEDNGFTFVRQNKHPIYSDGYSNIPFPASSGEVNHGLVHQIKCEIRRAIRKRAEIENVKLFKTSDTEVLAQKYMYLGELQKPEPEKEKLMSQKFEENDRKRLDDFVRELHNEGLSFRKMAERLNKEGFRTPTGLEINDKFASNVAYRLKLRKTKPHAPSITQPSLPKQPPTLPAPFKFAPRETAAPPRVAVPPRVAAPPPDVTPPPPLAPPPPPPVKPQPARVHSVRDEALALAEMIMGINWLDTHDKLRMLDILNHKAGVK